MQFALSDVVMNGMIKNVSTTPSLSNYLAGEQLQMKEKKKSIQGQEERNKRWVYRCIKLSGADMDTNGNEEYSDKSEVDDCVNQYGYSARLHVCKFHRSAIAR